MKYNLKLVLLFVLSLICVSVFPYIGRGGTSLTSEEGQFILTQLRFPRVLLGFFAGAGLSLAGLIFQGLFRNNLATPYTLGVSSGAAFMVSLWIKLGFSFSFAYFNGLAIAGFLGALLSITVVMSLASALKRFEPSTMILAGVGQGMFFSSAVLLIQYFGSVFEVNRMVQWTFGGVEVIGYSSLIKILPILLITSSFTYSRAKALNILTLDEDLALSRGINTGLLRKVLFLLISLLVGFIIAEAGPIAFIGLIAPHTMKRFFKFDYRYLIPASLMFGGICLSFCDLIGRMMSSNLEIPVGIVTAFLGGPFFLFILIKGRENS
ncbi:MAG: iron ABC transporter permease [Bacteriovoracaceae bacterium]|nr:iron ABC transporter permease [Bacteriovoracaceae bacterium]